MAAARMATCEVAPPPPKADGCQAPPIERGQFGWQQIVGEQDGLLGQRQMHGPRLAGERQQDMRFDVEQIVGPLPQARIVQRLECGDGSLAWRRATQIRRFCPRQSARCAASVQSGSSRNSKMRADDLLPFGTARYCGRAPAAVCTLVRARSSSAAREEGRCPCSVTSISRRSIRVARPTANPGTAHTPLSSPAEPQRPRQPHQLPGPPGRRLAPWKRRPRPAPHPVAALPRARPASRQRPAQLRGRLLGSKAHLHGARPAP